MRRVLLAVGTASAAAGGTLLLTPLSAPIEPPVVPTLGGVALLGLLVGAYGVVDRAGRAPDTAALPNPTGRSGVDAPGDEFDRALATASIRHGSEDRAAIRDRLETIAVAVVADAEGCSPDAARRHLERGDWTDDDAAAAFFSDDVTPSTPLRERVRRLVAGEPAFEHRARRVIDELVAQEGR